MTDWRDSLLRGVALRPAPAELWNPLDWPGYDGASAVRWGVGEVAGAPAVVVCWDFAVYGGSFGERDATAFCAAVEAAVNSGVQRLPLVTLVRSGGTRLQEGVVGLAGMARATLALRRLAEAGLAHLSIADAPTTGGVWVAITSRADVRAAVRGATVGFAGPRVAEAVLGAPLPVGSHTAESAYANGLVDALLAPEEAADWLAKALRMLAAGPPSPRTGSVPDPVPATHATTPARSGRAQVAAARAGSRGSGSDLLAGLLTDAIDLSAPRADRTVRASIGRWAAEPLSHHAPVVVVALSADRGVRATPDGFRLLTRAATLADRLDLAVVTLVDLSGAEPTAAAEAEGVAAAIGEAMAAVLACRSPTVALVHGEGGSGGALAGAVTDLVWVTTDSYFAALGPEGAAAALRMPADDAMDRMRVSPQELVECGFADDVVPPADDPGLADRIGRHLDLLRGFPGGPPARLAARHERWAGPVRPRQK